MKVRATDPKESIDNRQELQALVKIDAAAELVGEDGGHAGDPHGVLLAQPEQHRESQVSQHSWWCPVVATNGRTGGPSLAPPPPLPQNVKLGG